MISLKTLILVIILSFLIGVLIYFFTKPGIKNINIPTLEKKALSTEAIPTPKPTLPPLNSSSDLKEETEKTLPEDFSNDYKNLKDTLEQL